MWLCDGVGEQEVWGLWRLGAVLRCSSGALLYSQKAHLSCRTSPSEGHPEVTQAERSWQGHEHTVSLRMPVQQTCIVKKKSDVPGNAHPALEFTL